MYKACIYNIEQYWAFEKFAEDNNLEFNTIDSLGECIYIEFESLILHAFISGLEGGEVEKK